MKSLIEWVGGAVIIGLFLWIFFASSPQTHRPDQHAEMQAWCSLDKQLDKELLSIMDRQLLPQDKLNIYAEFRARDRALIERAREYQGRWGEHPGVACYHFSSQ